MSQILVSMSLYLVITVVNSSNTATDISGHSKQAQESQVNVIPSYKLKQLARVPAAGPGESSPGRVRVRCSAHIGPDPAWPGQIM